MGDGLTGLSLPASGACSGCSESKIAHNLKGKSMFTKTIDNIELYIAINTEDEYKVSDDEYIVNENFREDYAGPYNVHKIVISGIPVTGLEEIHIDLSTARRDEDGNIVIGVANV
jgi:hypothetical protein